MAAPKFRIRTQSKHAQVYYDISIARGMRLSGKTNTVIDAAYWSNGIDISKAAAMGKKKEAIAADAELERFSDFATGKLYEYKGTPDIKERLTVAINTYFGRIDTTYSTKGSAGLLDYFDTHIAALKTKGKSDDAAYQYGRLKKFLEDFAKEKKMALQYDNISVKFYHEFRKYLGEYSPGYVNLMTSKLIAVMHGAKRLGYHNETHYLNFDLVPTTTFNIYLTQKEVDKIAATECESETLRAVRDYFVLLCLTGAREGDALKWQWSDIREHKGVEKIIYRAEKTGKVHPVEITPEIKNILRRWAVFPNEYGFPNDHKKVDIYSGKINSKIGDIAKAAGITEIVNGQPKYELIKSHTGRRTAATLAYLDKEWPIWRIRGEITMHSSDAQTESYIKGEDVEIEAIMMERQRAI